MITRFLLAAAYLLAAHACWAQQVPGAIALQNAVQATAGCTVQGISIGTFSDRSTWRADYDPACTGGQKTAGDAVLATFNGSGAQTAGQSFAAKLAAGLAITSTGTSSISGTYAVDPLSRSNINGLVAGAYARCGSTVLASCTTAFPHNASTYPLLDLSGAAHTVTAAQFQAIGQAVEDYYSDLIQTLNTLLAGGSAAWPSASATIP